MQALKNVLLRLVEKKADCGCCISLRDDLEVMVLHSSLLPDLVELFTKDEEMIKRFDICTELAAVRDGWVGYLGSMRLRVSLEGKSLVELEALAASLETEN